MATYPLTGLSGLSMPLTGYIPQPLFGGPTPLQQTDDSGGWDGRLMLMRQLQMMEPLLDMLSTMLGFSDGHRTAGPAPTVNHAPPAVTGPAPATTGPAPSVNNAAAPPLAPVAPTQTNPSPTGRIGAGNRVLVIGDSHTAGIYGTELDRQLRARGAQVHTVGSSGASATHFITGRGTTVGYAEHGVDGRTTRTASHATPRLEELIAQDRPDTIVVNLGANFRGASPAQIQSQVRSLGEIARRHGIAVKWVGPPRPRDGDMNRVQRFDEQMAAAVAPYGEYISSVPYTPEYAGPDGRHYGGARGTQLARQWAQGIAGRL